MKTKLKLAGCALLLVGLVACNSVKGTYDCSGGIFLKSITLESSDKATVVGSVFGMTQQKLGTYKVDGDNVIITVQGDAMQFRHKGKTLDGGELVGVCTMR
jgi:hypothetical protein